MIVNYNGQEFLEPCLRATIPQAAAMGAEVVVVDNGSTDRSIPLIHDCFPTVRVVENRQNEGFAAGCNIGIRASRGDVIVLLNNDAVPEPGWLAELVAALEPDSVAIASSIIHDPRFPEAYALGTATVSVIGHPIPSVLADASRPFYATGCSLAFKRAIVGEPFEDRYFAYYEDLLLSWRTRLIGFDVARALRSSVQHLGSATARRDPGLAAYYYERNKLLTLLACYEAWTLWRLLPLYLFDGVARLVDDCRHLITRPSSGPAELTRLVRRYARIVGGLLWLMGHVRYVARLRRKIQKKRTIPDGAITPMLSGKIFDDHSPTTPHRIANLISMRYCRAVGIVTAEFAEVRPGGTDTLADRGSLPAPRS